MNAYDIIFIIALIFAFPSIVALIAITSALSKKHRSAFKCIICGRHFNAGGDVIPNANPNDSCPNEGFCYECSKRELNGMPHSNN